MRRMLPYIFLLVLLACVKDSDYTFSNTYTTELNSVTMALPADTLAADGASKITITINILPGDSTDSLSLGTMSISTSLGTFVENGQATLPVTPTFKLSPTGQRILTGIATLQSSTKVDTALIKLKYLNVEKDTSVICYRVFPSRIKLTASTLDVAPDYTTEDTIYAQLSRTPGTPSAGATVALIGKDSLYKNLLGIDRISNAKSNLVGQCSFVFVLGDSVVNTTNYRGTIHLIGSVSNGVDSVRDTLTIYSR